MKNLPVRIQTIKKIHDFLILKNMSYLISQLEKKIETNIAHMFKKSKIEY